jgi:hypothetical protein
VFLALAIWVVAWFPQLLVPIERLSVISIVDFNHVAKIDEIKPRVKLE